MTLTRLTPLLILLVLGTWGATPCRAQTTDPRARGDGRTAPAAAPAAPPSGKRVLRVGADPNNLPFSNDRLQGFENRIAEIVAQELGAELEYVWKPQRRAFLRDTLGDGQADLVMGLPVGTSRAATTKPYYRSTYVFVFRDDRGFHIHDFDDPVLRTARIGVHLVGRSGTPPTHALAARGLVDNLHSFAVYGDPKEENPSEQIIAAVAKNDVDVAVVWGPIGGYFAKQQPVPLVVVPVETAGNSLRLQFSFEIGMGVGKNNTALRDELDAVLARRQPDIKKILDDFGVPQLALATSAQ
jgi:mxaJ protein